MNKVYKSRVDKWFIWFCIGMGVAFIGSIVLCYKFTAVLLIDIVFMGLGVVMVLDMLLHTDYSINGEKLHIKCGILFRMDVPISKITEISNKSTILSSPALSLKRIGIKYGKTNMVYVSPEHQDDFINTLKSLNPDIQIS